MEDISASRQQPETEIKKQKSEEETGSYDHQIHDLIVKSPDVLSENECVDYQYLLTTEGSEVEWPFRDNMDRTPDWSDDGSISDEDSLIEISLPGGHYVKHKEEQPNNKYSMQHKLPDFMPDSIFQQRSIMEFLAELNDMNEEENLIEIDISMGSVKCSRFEIEA
ncbi:Nuclear transcription factor Y subunit B-3 [Hibiscus syriacus]|uniref:Nuclear transcription factor Y subunit B-3 n=1 Tax=Hibiscus syriacus TaxID=106335 RepID=A0A6A2Z0H4_HIBSY|nr:Nuclear transcription factor Y subunit B-3 [Hibiscus syriacus]